MYILSVFLHFFGVRMETKIYTDFGVGWTPRNLECSTGGGTG